MSIIFVRDINRLCRKAIHRQAIKGQVGKPFQCEVPASLGVCDVEVLTQRFYHETSKIRGEAFTQSYKNWQCVLQVSFAAVYCVLYRTYSRRTSNTRTWSLTFTPSDSLWSNGNRNFSSSTEKWKMESSRKRPFRFGARGRRWVLENTRAKIGGFLPRTKWIVLGLTISGIISCNACYVGETNRHFSTRVHEHMSSDRSSHVYNHLLASESCCTSCNLDCFKILDSAPTRYQVKLKESMYIKWEKPDLNQQVKHINLMLSL